MFDTSFNYQQLENNYFFLLVAGVMQASTQSKLDKRYSPNFRDESHRKPGGSKRKRDEVLM